MTALFTGNASDFLKIGVAATGRGDLATVQAVLAEKPHWLRRVGSHGRTMLWEAAYRGRLEVVEYLIDRGADIDACGCHFTPLLVDISPYCAARYKRHHAVAEVLYGRGAALDIHTAVKDKTRLLEVVGKLVDAGADRDLEDNHGRTPRSIAVRKRDAADWLQGLRLTD